MKINLLGTGGVLPIPRPCCPCRLCQAASSMSEDSWQTGPSMYLYDNHMLFDTPEEIRFQLLRANIGSVKHILFTHWHPDHTQGLRVIEQITKRRPETMPIHVHMAKAQFQLLCRFGSGNLLRFYEQQGMIQFHWFRHQQPILFENLSVTPIFIQKSKGYYFLIEDSSKKTVVYAPCEYHGLQISKKISHADAFIAHCLWFTDERIGNGMKFEDSEDSFETMLSHAKQLHAEKIYVTHIEESFGSSIKELNRLAKICYPEYSIQFASDGTVIEL